MFIIIVLIIYVEFRPYKLKHRLQLSKTYDFPEDGQQQRPKHVALIEK